MLSVQYQFTVSQHLEGSSAENLDSEMCLYSNRITDCTKLLHANQNNIFDYTNLKQKSFMIYRVRYLQLKKQIKKKQSSR